MQHNIRIAYYTEGSVHHVAITRGGRVTITRAKGATFAAALADAVRNFRTMIRAER